MQSMMLRLDDPLSLAKDLVRDWLRQVMTLFGLRQNLKMKRKEKNLSMQKSMNSITYPYELIEYVLDIHQSLV
jgi:hypothetical protein